MDQATFRFYDELNDFLSRKHRHQTIQHEFDWRASIKDMVESLGVPHSEIELLLVNGESVDFDHIVMDGDEIHVYPRFDAVEHPHKTRLRDPLPEKPAFVLDIHLGRLAAYLRMLGFDARWRNDFPDDELARIADEEERILLTRDVGCLKRGRVVYGYFVRNTNPKRRVIEVMERFDLNGAVELFKRCMKCNGLLAKVDKADVADQLRANTLEYYDEFHQCGSCERIFWKGSHYERMRKLIAEVLAT